MPFQAEAAIGQVRKRQTFYSLFDREIPDVKSVLRKKKKEILLSHYSRNRCPL